MDPNVQVAIATVMGTAVTTLGIVIVALINARKTKADDDSPDKDSPDNVLALMQALILENARKESTIVLLTQKVDELKAKLEEKERST
jgi:hypothetical protein